MRFNSITAKIARSKVRHESLVVSGRKGFETTALKYGRDFAATKAAAWRAVNPSSLEKSVAQWLTERRYEFKREVKMTVNDETFFMDFVVTNTLTDTVIEVDGEYWHSLPGAAQRDQRKAEALSAQGYTLVHLAGSSIQDGSAFEQLERVLF